MKNYDDQKRRFIKGIAGEVAKKIAKKDDISVEKAMKLFRNTKTFGFLTYSDELFVEEGPEDFFELYENEKKYG